MSCADIHNRFALARHVHACLTNKHLVFMDLRSDRYCCLAQADTEAVLPLLDGSMPAAGIASRTAELLRQLVDSQLLTTAADGKSLASPHINSPEQDLAVEAPHGINASHHMRFFLATTTTSVRLRWGSLDRTIERAASRKSQRTAEVDSRPLSCWARSINVFRALRPLYPKRNVCLFDSLALLDYLAYDGFFPTLVFAVRLHPWSAHCWLQEGSCVLNDTVDHVRDYTPILAI